MNNKDIEWKRKKLKSLQEEISSGQLNAFRELVPARKIEELCDEVEHPFRKRLLPPSVTIFHMDQCCNEW